MASKWKLGVTLAVAGCAIIGAWTTRDAWHWWLAVRLDSADAFSKHVQWNCAHAAAASTALDAALWRDALASDEPDATRAYLERFPKGPHADAARARLDDLAWERDSGLGHGAVYLELYPNGRHVAEARARGDEDLWQSAEISRDAGAYRRYLERVPDGPHAAEAVRTLDDLSFAAIQNATWAQPPMIDYLREQPQGRHVAEVRELLERSVWSEALRSEDLRSYDRYLEFCPNGPHADEARTIARGVDLAELVARGTLTAEVRGAGIQSVEVVLRLVAGVPARSSDHATVPDGLTVRIPAGTYFTSGDEGVQNMVAHQSARARFHDTDEVTLSVPAACSNKYRDIPGKGHGMAIDTAPLAPELASVMRELEAPNIPYPVAQAAIWICTDDANASSLDELVLRPIGNFSGGTPVIQNEHKAKAFELCARAGIDLRKKRIWRDRYLFRGALPPDLAAEIAPAESLIEAARWGTSAELDAFVTKDESALTQCLSAVAERNEPEFIRTLAKHHPNLDELFVDMLANGGSHATAVFLELGANVDAHSQTQPSVLTLAARSGDFDAVRSLLDHGAKVDGIGDIAPPLGEAVATGDMKIVDLLLERGAHVDAGRVPALIRAVGSGALDMVARLLDAGAEIDRQSPALGGSTALLVSITDYGADAAIVKLLLARGANPNLGFVERTPLQLAAEVSIPEIVAALLEAKADPAQHPPNTPTALELARTRLAEAEGAEDAQWPGELESLRAIVALLER